MDKILLKKEIDAIFEKYYDDLITLETFFLEIDFYYRNRKLFLDQSELEKISNGEIDSDYELFFQRGQIDIETRDKWKKREEIPISLINHILDSESHLINSIPIYISNLMIIKISMIMESYCKAIISILYKYRIEVIDNCDLKLKAKKYLKLSRDQLREELVSKVVNNIFTDFPKNFLKEVSYFIPSISINKDDREIFKIIKNIRNRIIHNYEPFISIIELDKDETLEESIKSYICISQSIIEKIDRKLILT